MTKDKPLSEKEQICKCGHSKKEHRNDLHGRRGKDTACDYATEYEKTNYGTLRPKDRCDCREFK